MSEYRIVLMTCPDKAQADKLARGLVESRLAACVNVVPGVESHYRWEGKIERAGEVLLIAKTRAALTSEVSAFVRKNHSYSVPEVVALDVADGNENYLDWVGANTIFTKSLGED
jgi:periplasmic divalent cation tolerance protein